jgi:hypothetical protein
MLFNFVLEYAIGRAQENQDGVKLNGTHQLSAYAGDVNTEGENTDTIKNNMDALLDANKEPGQEMNPEKTKYILMSRSQKMGQKHGIMIANRSFEDVTKFQYLRTTLTEQNCMYEEIKRELNTGNSCCHLDQRRVNVLEVLPSYTFFLHSSKCPFALEGG